MDDSAAASAPRPSTPDPEETSQPGPIFDTAVRECLRTGLAAFLPLVGEVDVGVSGQPLRLLPTSFPAAKLTADVVAWLDTAGAGRLVHVEIERVGTRKILARMFNYRAALMNNYPGQRINQHIIVLGDQNVPGFNDLPGLGVIIPLTLTYLRDLDPAGFLTRADLAPMAVLARGDYAQRSASYAAAVKMIRSSGGPQVSELTGCAVRLASIRLDASTMRTITQEAGMTIDQYIDMWRSDIVGETLLREGKAEGQAAGQAKVQALLVGLLRDRFGDQPDLPSMAERLAAWSDVTAALRAVTNANTLDDVRDAQPPIA